MDWTDKRSPSSLSTPLYYIITDQYSVLFVNSTVSLINHRGTYDSHKNTAFAYYWTTTTRTLKPWLALPLVKKYRNLFLSMVVRAKHALSNSSQMVKAIIGIVQNNTNTSLCAWFHQIKTDSPMYPQFFLTFSIFKGVAILTPQWPKLCGSKN